jgi:hypothetical protein
MLEPVTGPRVARTRCHGSQNDRVRLCGDWHVAIGDAQRGSFSLVGAAEELAFHRIETMAGCEEAIAIRVTHYDACCLRMDFDDEIVRHGQYSSSFRADNGGPAQKFLMFPARHAMARIGVAYAIFLSLRDFAVVRAIGARRRKPMAPRNDGAGLERAT